MEKLKKLLGVIPPCLALALAFTPTSAHADPGTKYCVTPAFVAGNLPPNLLLLIDNSASMYDLAYQDTAHTYCSNATTTACSADSTCEALSATCRSSGSTTSVTSYSSKPCTSDANCTSPGSKCDSGFCSKCNTNNGTGDCVSQTTTSFTPLACTTDATCSAATSGDTCNNNCNVTRECYDTTFIATQDYTGYFDSAATYSYDFTNSKFTGGATMPGTCTYSAGTTKYVCINTTGTGTAETVVTDSTGFVAKGNFLNWLTASKFDVEKQILTGGKYDSASTSLVAESRGCAGRKFVKSVPGLANITFGVRGGSTTGIGSTQSLATEYGQTYIDIHVGTYNASDCLSAMEDWMAVTTTNPPQLGSFQNHTKGCVGTSGSLADTSVTASSVWNHILHDCYQGMTGGAQSYSSNLGPLLSECQNIYASVPPNQMTDPNAGYAVCSSVLTYLDTSGNSQTGYLGACWNGSNFTTACTEAQRVQRMANYCNVNVNTNPVADPSSTSLTTAGQSAPGFILEQGLLNTQPVGTFRVRANVAAEPVGLIDEFKETIRFGAQTFQNNGSGSECGSNGIACNKVCSTTSTRICYFDSDCPATETCVALPKRDGGSIISYVGAGACSVSTGTSCTVDADCASLTPSGQYCKPSIGNSSSGMIKAINDIPATSWTPFAENLYNAMGYFARTNAYNETPPTSRSDANLSNLAAPNTTASYLTNKNPSQYRCQSNNILLITDGMSTADRNTASENFAALYASQVPNTVGGTTSYGLSGYDTANNCPPYAGSRSVSDIAWVAKNRGIKTLATSGTASTTAPLQPSESITTYVVYSGPETSNQPGLCDPKTLMTNTAANGGTNLYSAQDPSLLEAQIRAALSNVAAKAASGTAASILSNSEGSGANILQAVFYPRKIFDAGTYVNWIGEMQNLWYFVDPYINNSTIREDSSGPLVFNLTNDNIIRFTFDSSLDKTMVQRYADSDGNGIVTDSDKVGAPIDPDLVQSIWRAGDLLYRRDISSSGSPRTIYTPLLTGGTESASGTGLMAFSTGNATASSTFRTYLQNSDTTQATDLVKYITGFDFPGDARFRNRTVKKGSIPAATVSAADDSLYVTNPRDKGIGVWKLGDVISSTPRVQSTVRLNAYNMNAPEGYNDKSYEQFIGSNQYKDRGMVYVGANDGMLHAFNLGVLSVASTGSEKATLRENSAGDDLGVEKWAFVPKNALPYLKYFADKDYNHIYSVDGQTVLFDASIGDTNTGTCVAASYWDCSKPRNGTISPVNASNDLDSTKNTWRTIVIGSMGLGGASRNSTTACTEGAAGNCVKTPLDGTGLSSYFALDVTYPASPKLLWEFSNNLLGYSTTAPAIVRVGDKDKNGRWFAVFGNGPFGPIDTGTHQFLGQSDHHLRFFVVDLRSGTLLRTISLNGTGGTPDVDDAFAGTLLGSAIDADRRDQTTVGNYQDDTIYAGYVQQGSDSKWTNGGVIRIMTNEDPDPANWVVSKVIDNVGPVTTNLARLQDTRPIGPKLWLYFGTGRYFYRDTTNLDDNNRRALYGIQEPCYNTANKPGNALDAACTTTLLSSAIKNQTSSVATFGAGDKGWRIDLDAATTDEGAERVVTDTVAMTNGVVYFTTFKPTLDLCGYGGNSYLWGVKYDTGGAAASNALKGKALIQLSTGEFREVDLSTAFTDKLNRRMTTPMTGKPPAGAPPIVSAAGTKPQRKILHIQEH